MPDWVLLVSSDSRDAMRVEQEIRLAGFSPRTAPDLPRAKVLLAQGENPAAVVVDLVSTGEEGLHAVRALQDESGRLHVLALTPGSEGTLTSTADTEGAAVLPLGDSGNGALAKLLGELVGRQP